MGKKRRHKSACVGSGNGVLLSVEKEFEVKESGKINALEIDPVAAAASERHIISSSYMEGLAAVCAGLVVRRGELLSELEGLGRELCKRGKKRGFE